MMLVPWIYKVPDFSFINKDAYENFKCKIIKVKAAPDAAVQYKPIINRVPVSKKQAAPIKQQALF